MQKKYIQKISQYRALLWRGKKPDITCFEIELTERCDNNCIHCYINKPKNDKSILNKELSTAELKRIISEAASLGALLVKFTGGEPLLRADFKELYLFTRKLGLKVALFTNANLINQDLIGLFQKVPPLIPINISIYGMSSKCHESITRKKGSYQEAMSGIKCLLGAGIPFIVVTVRLPQNEKEFEKLIRWIKKLPWSGKNASYASFLLLRCRRDEPKSNLIKKLRMPAKQYARSLARLKDFFRDRQRFFAQNKRLLGNNIFNCGIKGHTVCLDAYGYLQPCMLLREPHCVYNLKKGRLQEALAGFFPRIFKKTSSNPVYLNRCARCFLKCICEQCPGKSWIEHGNLDTPVDYCCQIAHCEARSLGLLKNNEYAWNVGDWKIRLKSFLK
jgi:MoaA/NifB/PqqE/SkfB family radical SAM enzyme